MDTIKSTQSLNMSFAGQRQDRKLILTYLRNLVERKEGLPLSQLHKKYSEDLLFFKALQHVTTTKKAICKALDINIDNACRYKREFEKTGRLMQSAEEKTCPYTGYPAHFISTNPREFEKLLETDQLSLFTNGE